MKLKPGVYHHYKNKDYRVLQTAKDHETLADLVVYEPLYDNPAAQCFVRPLKEFIDEIEIDGKKQPRYKFLKDK